MTHADAVKQNVAIEKKDEAQSQLGSRTFNKMNALVESYSDAKLKRLEKSVNEKISTGKETAPNFNLRYVIENQELQQYLQTLRSPSATEQQKITALGGISQIYLNQGSTLTRDDISQTLSTINGFVLNNHGLGAPLLSSGCATTGDIFTSPANLITSDADSTLISLSSLVTDGQENISIRTAALQPMNQVFDRANFTNTQEQFGTVLGMLQTLLPDPNSPTSLKANALGVLTSVFSESQEANMSAAQVKACMQTIGTFVAANPSNQDACSSGMLAFEQMFGRGLPALIDNEDVRIGLETARIAMNSGFEYAMTYSIGFMGTLFRPEYNAAITSQDMKKGMDLLTSALSSTSFNVRQGALFYLKTILQNFIDFRPDLALNDLQSTLTSVSNYLAAEPDAYLKDQAISALQAGMNHKTAQFTSNFLSGILSTLKATADNALLPQDTRTAAGGAMLNGCFVKPEFFETSPYSTLFNLTAAAAQQMLLNSPDWNWGVEAYGHIPPMESKIGDYKRMYDLAKANPNAPAISSIFSTTGITYYGEFPQALLQHLYNDRNQLTGKSPLFMVLTTHRGGVSMAPYLFSTTDYLDKFDIRPVQPGSDTLMHGMFVSTAQRLGIEPKDVNPNGPKFRLFSVNGHASANILLLQPLLAGNDAALLQDMARYFASDSRGFVFGCESMGVPSQQYALPLAEMIAMNLGIKIWGAKTAMGTVDSTVFEQQNGQWAISDMYLGVPRTSADYRNVPALAMSGWTAVRTNNGVELDWSALSNSNTESFDVQRSKDGKVFERIGKVAKNGSGSYTFTDASPPQSDTLTYRISRRDSSPAPGHNDGSNDYTFAFSETREVGGVIGIGNNHEQPAKFELLQNYPNPFNSSTIIHYSIPKDEKVVLRLYNILGQEIATPINSIEKAGQHNITFDASNLASGIYFYRIDAGDEKAVKKMVLVK